MKQYIKTIEWTCDRCLVSEAIDDNGIEYVRDTPQGWVQVARCRLTEKLGNTSAAHLCPRCAALLEQFLNATEDEPAPESVEDEESES